VAKRKRLRFGDEARRHAKGEKKDAKHALPHVERKRGLCRHEGRAASLRGVGVDERGRELLLKNVFNADRRSRAKKAAGSRGGEMELKVKGRNQREGRKRTNFTAEKGEEKKIISAPPGD